MTKTKLSPMKSVIIEKYHLFFSKLICEIESLSIKKKHRENTEQVKMEMF